MSLPTARPQTEEAEVLLDSLVQLSRLYGCNSDYVIAGGGNTSVKIGERLLVKASGQALATIGPDGFVDMHRADLQRLLESSLSTDREQREREFKAGVLAARRDPSKGQRPSVEAILHHMVPGQYVVHTHATLVNVFSCAVDGRRVLQERLGDAVIWIDAVDPGFLLAKTLERALGSYRAKTGLTRPRAIVLQNHGLVIGGDSPEEIAEHTTWLITELDRILGARTVQGVTDASPAPDAADRRALIQTLAPALRSLLCPGEHLKVVIFDDSAAVLSLVRDAGGRALAEGGPLNPDQIVYCKSFPFWFVPSAVENAEQQAVRMAEELEVYRQRHRMLPNVVLAQGLGMFSAGDTWADAHTVRQVYTDSIKVMLGARRIGGVQYLSDDLRTFIEDWEVEAYRRQIAAGKVSAGRAAGKVALVTGAAQGFGLQICQDFAAQGGHVVLADLNDTGAAAEAAALCARHGIGRALALRVNVTEAASVADAVYNSVCHYGGLDLVVSNAGVLRAGSVKSQTEAEFDLSTAVNYRGFFQVVQKTAPILAMQHRMRPDYWGDIIQINSKSGLVGSNKNGAYAGSKFGGIGLTQSFALELVEDGIKVNAICPGNFFDGPLWSDPQNGLFVQYLNTGKVPGAKTIEDVKQFYESKIPMGRGCTTADVMKAIYYLIEQLYETGQALPVTGGQVMLH